MPPMPSRKSRTLSPVKCGSEQSGGTSRRPVDEFDFDSARTKLSQIAANDMSSDHLDEQQRKRRSSFCWLTTLRPTSRSRGRF